jgi:hypothetical protein
MGIHQSLRKTFWNPTNPFIHQRTNPSTNSNYRTEGLAALNRTKRETSVWYAPSEFLLHCIAWHGIAIASNRIRIAIASEVAFATSRHDALHSLLRTRTRTKRETEETEEA